MREEQRCPGWFRGLFVVVMLVVCVLLAGLAVERMRLQASVDDLIIQLDTSRGREARQTHEYEEAVAALPLAQAELENIAPLAEAAQQREAELRQQRKDIRAENSALQEQIAAAETQLAGLKEQAAALQEAAESLRQILGNPE